MTAKETIAAISTAHGKSAIGVIRVSGKNTLKIIKDFIGRELKPRFATNVKIHDKNNVLIDDVIVIYYRGPSSYTGEDMLEIQSHGNPITMDFILESICDSYARLSKPGEFTERAFLNNKIDLVQAEAIADLINASHISASKAAMITLQGNFSKNIGLLIEEVLVLRANIEACINFPEDDSPDNSSKNNFNAINSLIASLRKLIKSVDNGIVVNKTPTITIIGKPNVGKSSLANLLLGEQGSIVSSVPGTTRDALHHEVVLAKNNITIIDTAGLRKTSDNIELQGIEITKKSINIASLVLYVVDDSVGFDEEDKALIIENKINNYWVINNKIDLTGADPTATNIRDINYFNISTIQNLGINNLKKKLSENSVPDDETTGTARLRHREHLKSCLENLRMALDCNNSLQLELVAEELRLAHASLVAIMGGDVNEDLLDKIFSDFCIGK